MKKLRGNTTNPRLKKIRNRLIFQVRKEDELFVDEIGEIFRLRKSRISQILSSKVGKNNKK